jgi:CBS domain-containing protein
VNFYDALLVQDGHELHKIRPPQDLHGWQNLPIGAIANPHPVMVTSLVEDDLRRLLERHPYERFPLVLDGSVRGILRRESIKQALSRHAVPEAEPATICSPEQPVREAADRFLESPSGVIVLVQEGQLKGIITLHDLLRAQAAILD